MGLAEQISDLSTRVATEFKTVRTEIQAGGLVDPPLLSERPIPSAPAAGKLKIFAQSLGGRMMLKQIGPSGLDTAFQPFLARNKVGYWNPPGNATTLPGVFGFTAYTATGTATVRNIATTNFFTRMRRLGYVSAATAGALGGSRVAVAQVTTGTGTLGGFYKIVRFGVSDAVIVTDARMFVGVSASTAAPTNVEPSTLTNVIGIGCGSGNTTLRLYHGGSVAQTPIDLGANFPVNVVTNTNTYELAIFASPLGPVTWEVTRINTGDVATGTLAGVQGTAYPAGTTLLTYSQNWRSNNATAAAVGLDIMSDYIETDQ